MSLLSALGRGIGALGRGAAYLRRQRFGYTPEVEAAMRDNYLAALQADEEERAWKREEVEGRRQDRQLRRDELEREKQERKDREKYAATERALALLPGLIPNAELGPVQDPDLSSVVDLAGIPLERAVQLYDLVARRKASEQAEKASAEKKKAAEKQADEADDFDRQVRLYEAQQNAAFEGYRRREEWDAARPKPPKAANEFTFEEAYARAPDIDPKTNMPMTPVQKSEWARGALKEARQYGAEQKAIALDPSLGTLIDALRSGQSAPAPSAAPAGAGGDLTPAEMERLRSLPASDQAAMQRILDSGDPARIAAARARLTGR